MLSGTPALDDGTRVEALRRLHGTSGQTFVVTLGKDGVVAIRNGQLLHAEHGKGHPSS